MKKIFDEKHIQLKENFVKKKFCKTFFVVKNNFRSKKIFGQKNFCQKKIFWSKKNFQKKNLVKQNFWSKKVLVKKNFAHKKILFKKIFWLKKKFGQKCIRFLSKKNWVGLTLGRGFMTPPQKIVGLKLCGIVVSCLKRKFLFK